MNWAQTDVTRNIIRYTLAVILAVVAFVLRLLSDPFLEHRLPYWAFWVATAAAVWRLGVGPAVLVAILGLFLGFYYFVEPRHTLVFAAPLDVVVLFAYVAICAIICTLGGLMRSANTRMAAAAVLALEQKERFEAEVLERQRSEALLRGVLDSAPAGIWIVDRDGNITGTNATSDGIWGLSRHHGIYNISRFKAWSPTTKKRLEPSEWPSCRAIAEDRPVLDQEIEVEALDGSCRCILDSAVPLRDENGTVTGAIAVHIDITHRKEAEAQLQQERARIALLHEAAAQLLSTSGTEEQIQQIYHKVGGFFGADVFLEYATINGSAERELVVSGGIPNDAELRLKHLQFAEAFCVSIPERHEPVSAYRVQDSDHPSLQIIKSLGVRAYSVYPLLVADRLLGSLAFASRNKDQFDAADEEVFQTLARYVAIARDRWRLTASLQAYTHDLERAVQERTASLEESSARLRGIIETAVDAIMTFDDHESIETLNPATEKMFGYSIHEMLGKNIKMILAEPSRTHCGGNLDRYLETGEGEILGVTHDLVAVRKNGDTFPIQLSLSEGRLPNRRFFTAIIRDVTLRKQAEQRLKERSLELEQLSYSIIHDMRAPLRAMRSFGQMLQEDAANVLDEASKDFLRRIIDSAQRMDQLITDVFNFTAFLREALPLSPLNPKELLASIIETYPQFGPEHADIHLAGTFPNVLANRGGLTQCFSNLLNNGIKFAKPGQKPVIRVRSEVRGSFVRLWFEDQGIGIEPRHLDRIFDMFQKLDVKSPGTGIGLALVRKAVEKMDGRIGVKSEPGVGSEFWIELRAANDGHVVI